MSTNGNKNASPRCSRGLLAWSPNFPPTRCRPLPRTTSNREILCGNSNNSKCDLKSDNDARWTWRITAAMILPVPKFYPLEQSSITIQGIPINVISARISNFMRINSIVCTYSPDVAKVDCRTTELVRFALTLWRASREENPSTTENDLVVILELQKLHGSSLDMNQVRNRLFHTVTTGDEPSTSGGELVESLCANLLLQQVNQEQASNHDTNQRMDKEALEALNISLNLLKSSQHRSTRMGMESLTVLANPSLVCYEMAKAVSQFLVFGQGELGAELQQTALDYFQNTEHPMESNKNKETRNEYDDADEMDYEDQSGVARGCHFGEMHILMLQVLVKSLEVAAAMKQNPGQSALDTYSPFWKTVMNALVYNLSVSCQRPQEAAHSAKCLFLIIGLSPQVALCSTVKDQLLPVLSHANEYGKSHHLRLEKETQSLMGRLIESC